MVYRIENVFGKKGLNTTANAASGAYVNQTEYNYSNASQRYKLTYVSSGAYEITPMNASGKVLSIVNGRLCVETDSDEPRQRWYIVSTTGGNLIVNKAYPSQCLTIDGIAAPGKPVYSGISKFGNKWELHEITETVENYYDNGMLTRWGLTAAQMSTQIKEYMQFAADLYHDVFGITIEYGYTQRYTTSADTCTGYSTIAQLNSDCTTSSHTTDCKSLDVIWSDFREAHPGDANMVPILWTGHYTWDADASATDTGTYNAGIYSYSHSILLRDIGDDGSASFSGSNRIKRTSCHELAHEFGAVDSYCREPNGTGESCPENCFRHGKDAYPKDCIMAALQDVSNYSNDELFCYRCKSDIIAHLNAAH